ncbi:hypothetical protein RclHR1_01480007 [Rhizophagus clarus]|uniref:BTB domain-containing protein n=1 Tax=Rhizophagus clarus TaxID=94130 RepID=A0A2Z6QHW6_9GLOM|nr:hypothetical protein RclHR1_01480007 [Rhizophagus clarus]GET00888.1 hypothetical protein GLOIN_2v1779214 [Rhizophagus clarus]
MSNNLKNKFLEDISRLRNNSNSHDVKIIVGEDDNVEIFTTHSIILGTRSKYFEAAFYNEWTKKEDNFIVFRKPNIKPQVFSILLEYYYTGKYSLEDANNQIYMIDFFDAADELCLVELLEPIKNYIIHNKVKLAQQNYMKVYNASIKYEGFEAIREYCEELICKSPELLFESDDFNLVEEAFLIAVIKKDELAYREIEIFNYVVNWGMKQRPQINSKISELTQEDYERLRYRLHELLKHIRLFTLTSDEFYNVIWPLRKLFSNDLIDKLVEYHLCSNDDTVPIDTLPRRISKNLYSDIISLKQINTILNWIYNKDENIERKLLTCHKLELIHRGSRDGMDLNTFCNLCYFKNSTLIVIKLEGSDIVVGGYNPGTWNSLNYDWISDNNSFIFSLDNTKLNSDSYILSRIKCQNFAIKNFLNAIGFGDLQFLPNGIYDHKYYEKRIRCKKSFFIEDYEVFKISA